MSSQKKSSGGFLKSLFGFLNLSDEEAITRKKLKTISKKFNKTRFNKYYKFSTNEVSSSFPKLFFDIYKIILPAQRIFSSYKSRDVFKKIVINYSIPDNLKQIEASLTEENINKISKEMPINKLKTQAEERLNAFNDYFTAEKVTRVELTYKQLLAFRDFCEFDYFFMLKKFNKSLSESSLNQTPVFENVSGEYVKEDLKDLADIVYSMPDFQDWSPLFEVIKYLPGNCQISPSTWKKVTNKITQLRLSNALLMMIQMIDSNPNYMVTRKDSVQPIVESYLEKMRNDTNAVVSKLVQQEKQNKTSQTIQNLFGEKPVDFLKNYTDDACRELRAKQLAQFSYCSALNYLKAFLTYFVKSDLQDFYDIFIVRGKWESPALCAPISNAYHDLAFVTDQITTFDDELAESRPTGMKIKNLLPKAARDVSSRNIINRVVNEANDSAKEIITSTLKNIIIIGKIIKSLIEDLSKNKPNMLTNWYEVEHFCEEPLRTFLIKIYKKIFQFNELIQSSL